MTTTPQPAPKWRYISTIKMVGPIVRCDISSHLVVNATKEGISIDGWSENMKIEKLSQLIHILEEAGEAHKAIGPHGNHKPAKAWVEKANEEVKP